MSLIRSYVSLFITVFAGAALAGCAVPVEPPSTDATLTIRGSAGSPPSSGGERTPQGIPPGALTGNLASLSFGVHALYLSTSADCTNLVLVEDHGANPVIVDLADGGVLFSASPADGTYPCVVMQVSDILHMRPATSFGDCDPAEEYSSDMYSDGETDWKDLDGQTIIGHGSDEAPVDDQGFVFMTIDPAAAISQGVREGQILPIGKPLVVPGQSTFYWNGDGTVASVNGQCALYAPHPEFD
jgi:hypothetical protein